jgi:hypothetical protein
MFDKSKPARADVRHDNDQVPQAQLETRVPADTKVAADTEDDDLPVEFPSLEQYFASCEPFHSVIVPRSRSVRAKPLLDGSPLPSFSSQKEN